MPVVTLRVEEPCQPPLPVTAWAAGAPARAMAVTPTAARSMATRREKLKKLFIVSFPFATPAAQCSWRRDGWQPRPLASLCECLKNPQIFSQSLIAQRCARLSWQEGSERPELCPGPLGPQAPPLGLAH